MPRFFVKQENIGVDNILINGADAVHIGRSLRMRLGDEITVCCEAMEYNCTILSISDESIDCQIISKAKSLNEPDVQVVLFQAMPKGDKLDTIVQKCVELGVTEICPVITSRCVSRPDEKSFRKKLDRLNKIALEAAKQSGRGIVPVVSPFITFKECINRMKEMDFPLICYECGGKNLKEVGLKSNSSIGVFIGSEGGFDRSEAEECFSEGIIPIGLGSRILRCETAPIAALSIIMNLTDNM